MITKGVEDDFSDFAGQLMTEEDCPESKLNMSENYDETANKTSKKATAINM
jgi:hypothetical protein